MTSTEQITQEIINKCIEVFRKDHNQRKCDKYVLSPIINNILDKTINKFDIYIKIFISIQLILVILIIIMIYYIRLVIDIQEKNII
jgi:hypothetical protein